MKKYIALFLPISIILFSSLYVNDAYLTIKKRLQDYATNHAPEKIYLQTDKPYYTSGDTIWFKTYLVEGIQHLPAAKSKIAYVELINPKLKIVKEIKLLIENGGAAGMIAIDADAEQGNYILRAYTQYMRNGEPDYFYERSIPIWFQTLENEINDNIMAAASTPIDEISDRPAVNFYPEGGDLVNGLSTIVGVKTTTNSGYGIPIKGKIVDESGNQVAIFETYKFGLGKFNFTPLLGKSYTASITYNGLEHIYPLPKIIEQGYVMNIRNSNKKITLNVWTNSEESLKGAFVIGHLRGSDFFYFPIEEETNESAAVLSTENILDGVATFTLFSANGEPLCERLTFIQHPKYEINAQMITNKDAYKKREKVSVEIDLSQQSAPYQVPSNISIAVTDQNTVQHDPYEENIKTWLLLNSDLRGEIENPNYYFEKPGDRRRAYLLDALLLTHGWRRFTWKSLSDLPPQPNYSAEEGIYFNGKITNSSDSQKPIQANVFFSVLDPSNMLFKDVATDENGKFSFGPYLIKDSVNVIIQARRPLSEKAKSRRKKKNKRLGELDGNRYLSIQMEKDEKSIPPLRSDATEKRYSEEEEQNILNYLIESQKKKRADRQYDTRMILLEGVEVKSTRKEKNVYDQILEDRALYRNPSNRLMLDSMPSARAAYSVFELLRTVPGVQIVGAFPNQSAIIRGYSSITLTNEPTYLLDGLVVDAQLINSIPVADVYFVDVLKGASASIFGGRGANGVIAVYTRQGVNRTEATQRKPGIINFAYPGFYKAREFFAPDYATKKDIHIKPDYRTTLYWNPEIIVENGKANFSFYTADNKSTYMIRLEGITATGIPIVSEDTFMVED